MEEACGLRRQTLPPKHLRLKNGSASNSKPKTPDSNSPASPKTKIDESLPASKSVEEFLKDIKTFRKPLTHQKYEYVLELFSNTLRPSPTPGLSSPRGHQEFSGLEEVEGLRSRHYSVHRPCDPSPFLQQARGGQPGQGCARAYPSCASVPWPTPNAELKKFFAVCDDWERAFFT